MILADTSVVVPGLLSWHESHEIARDPLVESNRLISHVALETHAVLTRLPGGRRLAGQQVLAMLAHNFAEPPIGLADEHYMHLLATLSEAGFSGGSVYDALIGFTASLAGATLITLDRRAQAVYRAIGVSAEHLAP